MGSRRRAQHHCQIGARLETGFGTQSGDIAALLAFHFVQGYAPQRALPYLVQASRIASRRHAYHETVSHCATGLKLLTALPNSLERMQQELDLQMILGRTAMATKGFAAAEVEHAYTRAQALFQQVGEPRQLFGATMGLWTVYYGRMETEKIYDLGHQLLRLSQRVQDSMLQLRAHIALGETFYHLGEFTAARSHFEQGFSLARSQPHRPLSVNVSLAAGLGCMGWTLWHLGYPDLALQSGNEALSLPQEIAHPYSLAQVRSLIALMHQYCRGATACHEQTEACMRIAAEQGYPVFEAGVLFLQGWVLVDRGHRAAGIVKMQQGLAAWRATGSVLTQSYFLAVLADACGEDEPTENALGLVAEGLAMMHQTGECFYEAELHRCKGELLLKPPFAEATQAELYFHHALAVARGQQAKGQELRAAMSLARLWQQQGKRAEARDLLAPVYDWFTEGFDTPDLRDAQQLLEAFEC